MKNDLPAVYAAAAIGCLAGCAATAQTPPNPRIVDVPLMASPQNGGKIARATLAPRSADATTVEIRIGGVPPTVTRPVRLYTYVYAGTCGNLSAQPAYGMNQIVVTDLFVRGDLWSVSRQIPVPLGQLRATDYAIVVRSTPADGNVDLFCGNIGRA